MLVVLDTNHFSELARNSPAGRVLAARLEACGAEALTTIVNAQEVTQGWCALLNRLPPPAKVRCVHIPSSGTA